jgi:site-specific recombinase XerD
LFLGARLTGLSDNTITDMVTEYRKEAGIRTHATSHSLRKTSTTLMLKNGAPMKSVQQMLGHRALTSTMPYLKVSAKMLGDMHRKHHPREKEKRLRFPKLVIDEGAFRER